jgi:hypothetical protein
MISAASVSAPEPAGCDLAGASAPEMSDFLDHQQRGQRNGHQNRRSRAPPEGIRR